MIKGTKISLRAVAKEDLPLLMEWRNREDYRKYFREYRELTLENQENWFRDFVLGDSRTIMFTIVLNDDAKTPIGCCGLCYVNWVHRYADLSLYIGWENSYIDDVGYAREACHLLFRYGFGELNLHKIWTEIYEFDAPKYALYETLAFQQDGLLRENYFYDNRWWNSRVLSLLSGDYYAKFPQA